MDGGVETASGEHEWFHSFGKMHDDVRVALLKSSKAGNEPSRGESRIAGVITPSPAALAT